MERARGGEPRGTLYRAKKKGGVGHKRDYMTGKWIDSSGGEGLGRKGASKRGGAPVSWVLGEGVGCFCKLINEKKSAK